MKKNQLQKQSEIVSYQLWSPNKTITSMYHHRIWVIVSLYIIVNTWIVFADIEKKLFREIITNRSELIVSARGRYRTEGYDLRSAELYIFTAHPFITLGIGHEYVSYLWTPAVRYDKNNMFRWRINARWPHAVHNSIFSELRISLHGEHHLLLGATITKPRAYFSLEGEWAHFDPDFIWQKVNGLKIKSSCTVRFSTIGWISGYVTISQLTPIDSILQYAYRDRRKGIRVVSEQSLNFIIAGYPDAWVTFHGRQYETLQVQSMRRILGIGIYSSIEKNSGSTDYFQTMPLLPVVLYQGVKISGAYPFSKRAGIKAEVFYGKDLLNKSHIQYSISGIHCSFLLFPSMHYGIEGVYDHADFLTKRKNVTLCLLLHLKF